MPIYGEIFLTNKPYAFLTREALEAERQLPRLSKIFLTGLTFLGMREAAERQLPRLSKIFFLV